MPDQLESTSLHGMACHVKLNPKGLYLLAQCMDSVPHQPCSLRAATTADYADFWFD